MNPIIPFHKHFVVFVQSLSRVWLFVTPWLLCPSLSPRVCSNSCPLSQWWHPTISSSAASFSSCPQSFPASVFSYEAALHIRWPKYWSFSFNFSLSNEYSWLISFRIDRFDLLTVQGTLKSLFQHHSSKALILWCSAFFTVLVLFNHKMEILCKILKMRWTNICEAFDTWPGL